MAVLVILLTLFAAQASAQTNNRIQVHWQPQNSNTKASLRGLSVCDDSLAWASGSGGDCLRTTDGGRSWQILEVPDADSLDFRDVAAFDAETAYLMSAGPGEKSRIYKTSDRGATWQLQHQNKIAEAFFDGFDFWDRDNGMVYSDPVEGKHLLLQTADGGENWQVILPDSLPLLFDGEYGFAASGTGIVALEKSLLWICTGGTAARIFHSADRGQNWQVFATGMVSGTPSTGIFSIAFRDAQHGVAVGGDYATPQQAKNNVAKTEDGGRTWKLLDPQQTVGYRSCVAYVPQTTPPMLVTVGSHGASYSPDDGLTWTAMDTVGYHVVDFGTTQTSGWAAGADGRIAKLVINYEGKK